MLPSTYLVDQKLAGLGNTEGYSNQASDSLLYQNLLSSDSVSAQEFIASEGGTRDVMLFIPSKEARCSEPISQHHGLSLSLGTQEPFPDSNNYSNSSLCSFIHQDMQLGIQQLSQNEHMKNAQFLPFGSAKTCVDSMVGSNDPSFMPVLNEGLAYADVFCNSKYIKAAQDLLHELVNVQHLMAPLGKLRNANVAAQDGSLWMDAIRGRGSEEPPESTKEKLHDLQDKLAKLSSMLGEVERRYKLYCNQLRLAVSSFEMVAGPGAAFPYTTITLKTMSRQFRRLQDAIKRQIQASERSMGKQDENATSSGTLPRLRRVDEQLRNQQAIQHLGVMRRPWRPQRSLPETAISILRAWLFEHFLHPYPTDAEKLVLATRAGLSRGQVANWFINARVRLWKPMIEDIYREEFGDEGKQPKSPPETTTKNHELLDDREDGLMAEAVSTSKRVKRDSVSLHLGLQNNEKEPSLTSATAEQNHPAPWSQFSFRPDEP